MGFPCALLGATYLLTLGRRLLPDRKEMIEQLEESRREYLVEMLVQPGCRLVGKTIGKAGLRHLPGLFLIEIDRDGDGHRSGRPRGDHPVRTTGWCSRGSSARSSISRRSPDWFRRPMPVTRCRP